MLIRTPWGRWLDCVGGYVWKFDARPPNTSGKKYVYYAMLTGKFMKVEGVSLDRIKYDTEAEAQEALDKFFEELLKEDKTNG